MSGDSGHKLAVLAADPDRVDAVAAESVPALLGRLEELRARLELRMMAAATSNNGARAHTPGVPDDPDEGDQLIKVPDAAERLGVDDRWIYRRADRLPFVHRLGERTIRCSTRGIDAWLDDR